VRICSTVGEIRLAGVITAVAVEESEAPITLVAETLNEYFNPLVRVFANVHASDVWKGAFNVQVNAGLIGTPFSS
jgi:hypothetical protein